MPTQIRRATEADGPLILDLIRGLADYEHALDQVVATPELLHSWLFEKEVAEVIIAQQRNGALGTCKLGWRGEYTKFIDLSPRAREAAPPPEN